MKAPEDWRSPKASPFLSAVESRASVLECASPLALWNSVLPPTNPVDKVYDKVEWRGPTSLGSVVAGRVFLDHAPGVELGHQGDHGAANFLNPTTWNAVVVALEEAGNHFLGEHFVEIFAIDAILFFNRVGMRIGADSEAVGAIVSFAPPAIENAQVQTAVAAGFLSAG